MSPGAGSDSIRFVEVGPRDGFQNWPQPVSTQIKLDLVRAALAAGVPRVEATSMVSPRWVPQLADGAELLSTLRDHLSQLRVLVPNQVGYDRAVAAGARNVLVNVGVTEGFNLKNLNRSVTETLAEIQRITIRALAEGVRVDASLSVSWGCPFDGPVTVEQVMSVAEQLVETGVSELSFGDTIGVATPPGVERLSAQALEKFPAVEVAMHFHDTRGLALANTLAAAGVGVRSFEGSIGGIGGCPFAPNSTGNVCSEDQLALLESLGYRTGIDIDQMIAAARRLTAQLGTELPGRLQRAGREPWRSERTDD